MLTIPQWAYAPHRHLERLFDSYPLFQKITPYWQKSLYVASTTLAIIGIASSIFSGAWFQAIAFFTSAGACYLSYHYVQEYLLQKTLKTQVEELSLTNASLQKNFKIQTQELSSANANLRTLTQQIQSENKRLETSNTHLKTQVDCLQRQVTTLQRCIVELSSTSSSLKQSGTLFDARLAVLDSSIIKLNQQLVLSKNLPKELQDIRKALDALKSEINLLKK